MPLSLTRRGETWHIVGTVAGRRIRQSAETGDRRLAEEARAALESRLLREQFYGVKGLVGFDAAAESYLQTQERSVTTVGHVGKLTAHFGPMPLKDINQTAVDAAYKAILQGGAQASGATKLRAVLTPLRAILEHAAVRGWCERPAFEAPKVAKATTAFLLPGQATALVQAAAPHLRPLLVFLIGTGCRMSEALDLEWAKVDLRGARAVVWQKQQNERHVDLPPVVLTALATIPSKVGFVFKPNRPLLPATETRPAETEETKRYADMGREGGGQIATAWLGACQRAGLPGRMVTAAKRPYFQPDHSPHDCRHTWASWHYAIHKDPLRLMVTGGWSGLSQVQRYAHLLPEAYVEECRAWLAGGINEARRTA